jgi:hypothetical protein
LAGELKEGVLRSEAGAGEATNRKSREKWVLRRLVSCACAYKRSKQ